MKKTTLMLVAALLSSPIYAQNPPPGYCEVKVCNKIERWSLSPWSHLKDKFGETCSVTILPKQEAVKGKVLSSDSRWYQGSSINPTKKSVTRVKEVKTCN